MNIKKSNTYKLYLALQIKLKSWQLESLLGLGEYRSLNDLATDIETQWLPITLGGIYTISTDPLGPSHKILPHFSHWSQRKAAHF